MLVLGCVAIVVSTIDDIDDDDEGDDGEGTVKVEADDTIVVVSTSLV